ncbi:high frequency lysogenization protein HflD [Methylosoma difficile]
MQLNTPTNQTLAMAGIAQSAMLVQQLATNGSANLTAMEASIGSILKIDSDSVIDVYGSLDGLKLGLETLQSLITGYRISDPELARYCASLVFLEQLVSKQPTMLKTISTGVAKAQAQSELYGILHENVMANLSDIYQNTLSTLNPRIMVNGNEAYLSRTDIADKVRVCLLAGIRSAILWRQCGGARWKFLFYRKKFQAEVQNLLKQA